MHAQAQQPATQTLHAPAMNGKSHLDAILDQPVAACPAPVPAPKKPGYIKPKKQPLPVKKPAVAPQPAPAPAPEPEVDPVPKGYTRLTGELEIRPNKNYLQKGAHGGNRPWWVSGKDAAGKPVNVTAVKIIYLAIPEMAAESLPTPKLGCNMKMNLGSVYVKATDIAISRERK